MGDRGKRRGGDDLDAWFESGARPRNRRRGLFVLPIFGLGMGMMVLSAAWVMMSSYLGMWDEGSGLSAEYEAMVVDGDGFAVEVWRKLSRSAAWYTGLFWLGAFVAVFGVLRLMWLVFGFSRKGGRR